MTNCSRLTGRQLFKAAGLALLWLAALPACTSQSSAPNAVVAAAGKRTTPEVGGGCDGCELMHTDRPEVITATDTSDGWHQEGQKLLVTGRVVKPDGRSPAPDVVLYYWQTDNTGRYAAGDVKTEGAKRHGRIRGWVKTDANGRYSIYTIRPAPYPGLSSPAHIHVALQEPGTGYVYYLDDMVFDDDPLLKREQRSQLGNRGGSGVLRVLLSDGMQVAERNIVLGLNIPYHPADKPTGVVSGLSIGEDQPSFMPYHAWGPDKGTRTCPVCKYGRYHGIMYFVGNKPDWQDIKKWIVFLEKESQLRDQTLKAFFIYGNEHGYSKAARIAELQQIGQELQLKHVALTFVPSMEDADSEANLNKINAAADNTFIIYRHRNIVDKFINLRATTGNFERVSASLNNTRGNFFHLPEPLHD